ncbi:hypothetical protein [Microbacterium gilvum]|uniref:Uncharacterized protein n=1 Tax=Microbacterium gilvum TaxID=1336204 RepID=A0ABP9A582_9MICO
MDISDAILARSDQLNAVDLVEPVTVTVVDVRKGNAEQPVHIITDVFGPERPFKPSKTVLRDLGKAWGRETQPWIGRRIELYNEPTVKWAGKEVGGIRVSGLSHIDGPVQTAHTITRGQYKQVTIRPLPSGPDPQMVAAALEDIAQATSIPALKAAWDLAGKRGVQGHPDVIAAKEARKTELA